LLRDDNSEGESMSATITLRNTMARRTDTAWNLVQHSLMIAAFLLVLGFINIFSTGSSSESVLESALPDFSVLPQSQKISEEKEDPAVVLSPGMQGALEYVKRRYRVSQEALMPVFEMAQLIGKERRIDPLLIVAVIGVESGFNPFAESAMGAQGLMQIIPRFHLDKLPNGAGDKPLLDPIVNIKVGVHVLEEAIRRRGGLVAGLQYYAGSSDPEGSYASKVLAEKERLEQASRRRTGASV
jgi:hypothetical protein